MKFSRSKAQGNPTWVECATSDLDTAEAFYGSLFGWTSKRSRGGDGTTYAVQQLGSDRVAAIRGLSPGSAPHWRTFMEVENLAETVRHIEEAGGKVMHAPHQDEWLGTVCAILDPVGAPLWLWHSGADRGAQIFNAPGTMTWNELATDKPMQAATFYTDQLGMAVSMSDATPPYRVLSTADGPVAGILQTPSEMHPHDGTWDVYFACDDVDQMAQKAESAGGTILKVPFEVGGGVARMAVIQDPTGAVFELIQSASG